VREGQDVYFHLNHPIKWVRICGVVVAVDERETKRFYMIDDGSGATIECIVKVPPPAALGTARAGVNPKSNANSNTGPTVDGPIDVGHVLDIKGSVTTFRANRQVCADKIVHLRSTEQEVVFWEKIVQLRRDVLSKPWVLDRREVRRCRMEEEGRYTSNRHKETKERHSRKQADRTGLRKTRVHDKGEENARLGKEESKAEPAKRPRRVTGLESRKTRPHDEGEESSGHESKSMRERRPEPEKRPKRVSGLESRKTGAHDEGAESSRLEGRERENKSMQERRPEPEKRPKRVTGLESMKTRVPDEGEESSCPEGHGSKPQPVKRPKRVTGLEGRAPGKPIMRLIPVTGNYDALGL
jgi:hypothetical protein